MAVAIANTLLEEYRLQWQELFNASQPDFSIRLAALDAFLEKGFPTTKQEDWRYTNLAPIVKEHYLPQAKLTNFSGSFGHFGIPANRLVFINGTYAPEFSEILDSSILTIEPFQLSENDFYLTDNFNLLNRAFANNGLLITIKKGQALQYPILLILQYSDDTGRALVNNSNRIVAEENSQAHIIEFHQYGESPVFNNTLTTVSLGQSANISYQKVQAQVQNQVQVHQLYAQLARQSVFTANAFDFGGRVVRNNVRIDLNGEHAEVHLNGLYAMGDKAHIDNHLNVNHFAPNCHSNQLYKGLINDNATGVFNGRIFVAKDAQKTNAFQSNKNILLSDAANITSKPQLEIFADDVKCSHGSTTGQMDKQALFYLQARGLDKQQATALLNVAFAGEIIDRVTIEPLREWLVQSLNNSMGNAN
ncbi:MAG: Fe-S cluster assembly protein SufD [Chitinophagales bacterium]|nr:Fe-S cluster assembly protein SufD [Chitinophagales bacterium]